MLYPQNFEEKIGFDSIREMLVASCLCQLGKDRVAAMRFTSDYDVIRRLVRQTTEFQKILHEDSFPDQNFHDLRAPLKRIRIENTYLDVQELFDLQRSLQTICLIVAFLQRGQENDSPLYPELNRLTADVTTYPHLVKRIGQILDKFGNVKDSASPALAKIRLELSQTAGGISRLLQNILRSAKDEGLVGKDSAPTVRDGRLVIPVVPAMKRRIRGIVHDESDSGRTVFIEPAEVVEANNRIRELEAEERHEIIRILMEFTATVRPELHDIARSYDFLADVDFIRSKAKLADTLGALEPQIENKQIIDWGRAVHPLLWLSLRKHDRRPVPLDLLLNKKQRILVISGPNAGGKSVCLKTVGLLQYMLQCGMPIPVAESSRCGVFQNIFIDIGDEQSLEDDLSTYSSHLLNMKQTMKFCNGRSLILIDEFGGGTEPQIGGAMAEAMLQRFNRRHTFGVITTHYQNLKQFASETEGVQNGAMLYDRQEMKPLFILRQGNPGSSFAVEIARKIGIPEDVIKDASDIVGKEYINSDKYLQDIVRDKRYWENKRQTIHQHEKQMEETISRYEAQIEKLQAERRAIIEKAKAEAEELLKNSNARIEQTIKEIKEAQAERERTRHIRQDMAEFKQEVQKIDSSLMEERIQRQLEKLKRRRERKANKDANPVAKVVKTISQMAPATEPASTLSRPVQFAKGEWVRKKDQSVVGQIQKMGATEAQVAFGGILMNVKFKDMVHADPPKQEKRAITFVSKETQDEIREKSLNFRQEIDLRGMRGDEAVQAVTYFIDDALVAGVSRVRILHGTGTGILKTLIRQYLNAMPAVADFHDEHPQFGGAGVTVVDLM